MKCFVTGTDKGVKQFLFCNLVKVNLCEKAFAHFVLVAEKDETHQDIQRRLIEVSTRADEFFQTTKAEFSHGYIQDWAWDNYISRQLTAGDFDAKIMALDLEKAQSAVRILRELRDKFQKTGSLD